MRVGLGGSCCQWPGWQSGAGASPGPDRGQAIGALAAGVAATALARKWLLLDYEKRGFLPVDRRIYVPWGGQLLLPNVVMTPENDVAAPAPLGAIVAGGVAEANSPVWQVVAGHQVLEPRPAVPGSSWSRRSPEVQLGDGNRQVFSEAKKSIIEPMAGCFTASDSNCTNAAAANTTATATQLGSTSSAVSGIAFTPDGDLWILTPSPALSLLRLRPGASVLEIAATHLDNDGTKAATLVSSPAGTLYYSREDHCEIYKLVPGGGGTLLTKERVAGNATCCATSPGDGASASGCLPRISAIDFDREGNLLFVGAPTSASTAARLWRIDSAGKLQTDVGAGAIPGTALDTFVPNSSRQGHCTASDGGIVWNDAGTHCLPARKLFEYGTPKHMAVARDVGHVYVGPASTGALRRLTADGYEELGGRVVRDASSPSTWPVSPHSHRSHLAHSDRGSVSRRAENRDVYSVTEEPRGSVYRALLALAREYASHVGVVVQDLDLSPDAERFLTALRAAGATSQPTDSWPGTTIGGPGTAAMLYRAPLNDASFELLTSTVGSLYEWESPSLPEDLHLMRPDGTPWLVSISHERDSYLVLTADEFRAVAARLPQLRLRHDRVDPS